MTSNTLTIAERVDITQASFDLPGALDNLDGLTYHEQQLYLAYQDIMDSETRFAYHLYMILKHQLYLHAIQEATEIIPVIDQQFQTSAVSLGKLKTRVIDTATGEEIKKYTLRGDIIFVDDQSVVEIEVMYPYHVFPNQQEYLRHLDQVHGRGQSTMKRDYGALKMAESLGYDEPAQIADKGIEIFVDAFNGFKTDRETGRVIDLKSGDTPNGQTPEEYARFVIDELASGKDVLTRREYVKRREQVLRPNAPKIGIEVRDDGGRHWYYEKYANDQVYFYTGEVIIKGGLYGVTVKYEPSPELEKIPDEVLDYIYLKLM
jgi:hypothetical protein